jgi:hypothetical protein
MLAREQVADHRLFSVLVPVPLDSCRVWTRQSFSLDLFGFSERFQWRPIPSNIKVFVQVIQHEFEKFFCILLFVNDPLAVESAA